MKKESWKNFWKKFWFVVWKDDSFKGCLISVLFLFVVIKFIFFPILNLTTGTELPLAIVESCSMYHDGNVFSNYDSWWQRHETKYSSLNLTQNSFSDFSFKNGFGKGDILFIIKAKPDKIKVGDVIIFNAVGYKVPIIHRVINIKNENGTYYFSTEGDNNWGQISGVEEKVSQNQIVGKAVVRAAPFIGWMKLIFYEKSSSNPGSCHEFNEDNTYFK